MQRYPLLLVLIASALACGGKAAGPADSSPLSSSLTPGDQPPPKEATDGGAITPPPIDAGQKQDPLCYGSEECQADERCSTERGECLSSCNGSDPNLGCPAVCMGHCEAKPTEKPQCMGSDSCGSGEFCTTEIGVCDPPVGPDGGVGGPTVCMGTCEKTCSASLDCAAGNKCVIACFGAPPPPGFHYPPSYCAPAPTCTSSSSCAQGERCSTEAGDCKPPPGSGNGGGVPGVCTGVCEPIPFICP